MMTRREVGWERLNAHSITMNTPPTENSHERARSEGDPPPHEVFNSLWQHGSTPELLGHSVEIK